MSRLWKAVTNALMAAFCLLTITSCHNADSPPRKSLGNSVDVVDVESLRPAVTLFCGDCHAPPIPETFPRDAWFAEVEQGYRFYVESGRSDLKPPPMRDAVAFFRAQAPESLEIPRLATSLATSARFRKQALPARQSAPAISFLDLAPHRGTGAMWLCDMHSGALTAVSWDGAVPTMNDLARLGNPAHLATCDLDGDGRKDLIVADLGSYTPGDHQNGKIWWLSGGAEPDVEHVEPQVLLEGVGRIADVQPADFDGDGNIDLVVAEFGWRKTGRIALLLQNSPNSTGPEFTCVDVDRRPGTIHVPVCDLNQDGKPDFVALISQEHELVEAYLNLGDGQFEKQRIFTAGDPAFGSSGIEIVDLDRDGDLDVLFTNGDTLDSHYLKPTHGILWLENHGGFPFFPRQLTYLPGAMRAVPTDLDGDGDLDIVAAAFLPAALRGNRSEETETLIWLEQTTRGEFERHTLELGSAGHMTVLAADLDGDGDIDLAVPNYAEQRSVHLEPAVIWWNELSAPIPEK